LITGPVALAVRITSANARDWMLTHGLRVLLILGVVLLGRVAVNHLVPRAVSRAVLRGATAADLPERTKRADTLSRVLANLAIVSLLVIGAFIVLSEVGYNLAPVITGLGISGVAIALGAQSLVKDTINGLFILGENQFRVGDYVTVAAVSGTVEEITLRRTVLRDIDGTMHSVPNSSIQVSSNHTRDFSGVNLLVLVSHDASLEDALAIATKTGTDLLSDPALGADVIEAPRPARIESIDEKGVTLRVLGRVRPGAAWSVSFEYRRRLKKAFDAGGLRYTVAVASPPLPPAAPDKPAAPKPPA
jgi:moderate conductance mechanosensitive channel